MNKLSWINKVMFSSNIALTVLTFLAYVLPFLAPKFFPILSVLTLILPLFLIINGLFFLYWMFQLKRQMILSGIVLIIGITFINKFYKFSSNPTQEEDKDFIVMSYNVRLFNLFNCLIISLTSKLLPVLNEFCDDLFLPSGVLAPVDFVQGFQR